jgi:AcrR family transcriptional regulator
MGRRPQPRIRERLLDGGTRFLLDNGLPAPSLTPIAAALGTSPRMLIYHFGTKDKLVREALVEARRRQRALFDAALTHRPGVPYADTLAAAWSTLAGPEGQSYVRLFSAVHALPDGESPWGDFPVMATHDWLPILEAGLRADGYPDPPALATLALAVARGLFLDRRSTGEYGRGADAYAAFIDMLRSRRG